MHIETTSRDAAHADAGAPPKGQPAHSNPVTYINATEHSTLLDVVNAALAVNSSNDVVATLLGKSYTVTETMTLTRSLVLQGSQDAGRPTVLDCNGVPSMSVFITQAMNITLLNLTLSGCAETAVLLGMPTAQPGVAGTQAQPCVLLQGCSFLNNSGVAAGGWRGLGQCTRTHVSVAIGSCNFFSKPGDTLTEPLERNLPGQFAWDVPCMLTSVVCVWEGGGMRGGFRPCLDHSHHT